MGIIVSIVAILLLGLYLLGPKLLWRTIQSIRASIRGHVSDAVGEPTSLMSPEDSAVAQWIARGGDQIKTGPLCKTGGCLGKSHTNDPDCVCNMRFHQNVNGHWYRIDTDGRGGYRAVRVTGAL